MGIVAWSRMIVWELLELDRNTWCFVIILEQMIITVEKKVLLKWLQWNIENINSYYNH